jgi:putative membrane protein
MTRMRFLSISLAAVLAIGCNAENRDNTAGSNSVGTAGDTDRHEVQAADKDFVNDLAIAGMAEVELGKLALERSTNAEVKEFGQMMLDDHTQAGNTLKGIASAHNIPVPTDLDDEHRELRDKLAKLKGADFDREYMAAMVDGHEGVADQVESRIDETKLAEWKSQMSDRVAGTKVEERSEVTAVLPEKSDNAVTMAINQWAADAYPVVQAHLEAAKALATKVKSRG